MKKENLKIDFNTYLREIEKAFQSKLATEHTYRPFLKTFVESFGKDITAINEPKRRTFGAPDYVIRKREIPLGYIEAKDVGKDLDKFDKREKEQLKKYLDSLNNIIYTNYLDFRWYVRGEVVQTITLAEFDALGNSQPKADAEIQLTNLFKEFLNKEVPTVATPKELAKRMASITKLIRQTIEKALTDEENSKENNLHEQFESFQKTLLPNLTEPEFADLYSQTIAYGLFTARCFDTKPPFTRKEAAYLIPKTNPFLKQTFDRIGGINLDERIVWAVDDLAELLNRTDISAILQDFGKRTRREDPVVHFYETFLAEYDPKMREARGVYYTPEPVVSYIVRSADKILQNDFGLPKGLADSSKVSNAVVPTAGVSASRANAHQQDADATAGVDTGVTETHRVLILDPATGTGTFLYSVIKHIAKRFDNNKGMWDAYVSEHLLPRIFGFELLVAPYAVAHLKLGLLLEETGYKFASDERLRIYLNNTLDFAALREDAGAFSAFINNEARAGREIQQDKPVMVILGNPPYSGHSANTGNWINGLLRGTDSFKEQPTDNYFMVDGKPLGERNPKWLNDDYVKFIRFSQWRIDQTGYGILAFVTNHGYLDNPTFRGMRQSLMKSFDEIYILDLHGNSKKKEKSPDGTTDQNVFDIQQGVSIGIFIKRRQDADTPASREAGDTSGNAVVPTAGKEASRFRNESQQNRQDADEPAGKDAGVTGNNVSPTKFGEVTIRNRGRLPHWEREGGTYFVTFRLADSLPKAVLERFEFERETLIRKEIANEGRLSKSEEKRLDHLFSEKIEEYLDAGYGNCDLKNPQIAELVADAFKHFDGERYRLLAWCVMPNHVHIVFRKFPNHKLEEILHSWKSFTAKKANEILGKTGKFWQREYYDRLIRDEEEFANTVRYVLNNPAKAGLVNWQWVDSAVMMPEAEESGGERDAHTPADRDVGGTTAKVFHKHLYGVREIWTENANDEKELTGGKYQWLLRNDKTTTEWTEIEPNKPFYLFTPQDETLREEYQSYWKITDIMLENSLGILTKRDNLVVSIDKEELIGKISNFIDTQKSVNEVTKEFGLSLQDKDMWNAELARSAIKQNEIKTFIKKEVYRLFDKRYIFYHEKFVARLNTRVMFHFEKENVALCLGRQGNAVNDVEWALITVSSSLIDQNAFRRGGVSVFPLYLYPTEKRGLFDEQTSVKQLNFSDEFIGEFSAKLNLEFVAEGNAVVLTAGLSASRAQAHRQDADVPADRDVGGTFSPEQIFYYAYAVFHSPTYRARYAEFLKIDFPRLPLTSNYLLFFELARFGERLVDLHLLETDIETEVTFPEKGSNEVEFAPKYKDEKVYINKTQYFENVPETAWNFHIGGYQVLYKWLKDRKGRTLNFDALEHYAKVVSALSQTIELMEKIDETIEENDGFPIE